LPPELLLLAQIYTKSFVGWGFAPDLTGGAYSAPPEPLAGLVGGAPGEREGGKGRKGRESRNAQIQSWQTYMTWLSFSCPCISSNQEVKKKKLNHAESECTFVLL